MGLFDALKKEEETAALVPAGRPSVIANDSEAQTKLFEALEQLPNVAAAARKLGIHVQTVYALKKRDKAFAALMDDAIEKGVARAEQEIWRRGIEGIPKSIWYQGEKVAEETQYSDTLLQAILRAHHPAYRDRSEIDVRATVDINWVDLVAEQRKRAEKITAIDVDYDVDES